MKNKKMYFIDEKNNSLIEIYCAPKKGATYNFKVLKGLIYWMKLDNCFNEKKAFKDNKTTGDFIEQLNCIAHDNIIDLSPLINVLNSEDALERRDIKILIIDFLSLFEYKKNRTYSGVEMNQLINHLVVPTVSDTNHLKRIVVSSKYNTKILKKLNYNLLTTKKNYSINSKVLSYEI